MDRHPTLRACAAIAAALALALILDACGASAHAANAQALEVSALAAQTAGDAIALASEAEAARECPASPDVDACLDALAVGWAPVDRAFGLLRSALGAWYVSSVAARRLGDGMDLGVLVSAASAYAEAYGALALVALDHGLRLPALPSLSIGGPR